MNARTAATALLSLWILAVTCASFAADTAMRVKIGDRAPDFRLRELSTGKAVSLAQFRGNKVVMLEFFAAWCDICDREIPDLRELYSARKDRGFELLAIAVPPGDAHGIRDFVQEKRITYPTFLDEDLDVAARLYGLSGPIPVKVVIDHRGIVRYAHVGDYPTGNGELSRMIDDLVKEMKKENGRTASRSQ